MRLLLLFIAAVIGGLVIGGINTLMAIHLTLIQSLVSDFVVGAWGVILWLIVTRDSRTSRSSDDTQ